MSDATPTYTTTGISSLCAFCGAIKSKHYGAGLFCNQKDSRDFSGMTPLDLTPIKDREAKASKKSWDNDILCPNCGEGDYAITCMGTTSKDPEDDPNWIRCPCGFRDKVTLGAYRKIQRHSRTDIPALIAEVERLRGVFDVDKIRKAYFYLEGLGGREQDIADECLLPILEALTPSPKEASDAERMLSRLFYNSERKHF